MDAPVQGLRRPKHVKCDIRKPNALIRRCTQTLWHRLCTCVLNAMLPADKLIPKIMFKMSFAHFSYQSKQLEPSVFNIRAIQ